MGELGHKRVERIDEKGQWRTKNGEERRDERGKRKEEKGVKIERM